MRKVLRMIIGAALAAAPIALLAPATPALASGTGSTPATFTVQTGVLSITVPSSAAFGVVAQGATHISGLLGDVQVVDSRGALSGSWTATASSTAFTTGAGTPAETIPASSVLYDPGEVVASTGTGTFTPGAPGDLSAPRTAFSATGTVGNTSVTWDPQIIVNLPPSVVSGTYNGTITHSVA